MCRVFEELFKQGIEQGAKTKVLDNVKSLMSKMNMSLVEAIEVLGISDSEKRYILENIER